MAIHPTLRRSHTASQNNLSPQQAIAISVWTEQAAASLQDLSLSESVPGDDRSAPATATVTRQTACGTSVSLAIPLDDEVYTAESKAAPRVGEPQKVSVSFRRRPPIRRDSLKRREALLKGKDGSRRRQRWENDRLLNNPWAEPPSANDWLVQPTYPRHDPVPYYLAPLWDIHYSQVDRHSSKAIKAATEQKHRVPKELRTRLKHARGARGMLQGLEEDVRNFVQRWNEKQLMLQQEESQDVSGPEEDSEDEIVFVGRNGQEQERKPRLRKTQTNTSSPEDERYGEKMVFESMVDDRAAGFGRWLVHCIASYYGLHTWSVTTPGQPARREAYVGFYPPNSGNRTGSILKTVQPGEELPVPLWAQL